MTHIEIVLPSWSPELPERLKQAFHKVEWYDAGGSECLAILGCDLLRALTSGERQALREAQAAGEILLHRMLTR